MSTKLVNGVKVELSAEEQADFVNRELEHAAYVSSLEYVQKRFEALLRTLIEGKPAERGYDNVTTLCSYTTSSNAQWKAEADVFIIWRDTLFSYAYQVLADMQDGKIEIPNEQEFLDNAPQLVWP